MIRFLYTGAQENLGQQIDPEKSLGGFVSSSIIPIRKNNLFQDISYYSMFNEVEEFKAIVIENSGEELSNFRLGYSYDKQRYNIQLAIVELNEDGKMELIGNWRNQPYYAEFYDLSIDDEEDNSVLFETMPKDKKYGIWIKRKVKKYNNQEESTEQKFEFIIKFDENGNWEN